MRLLYLLLFSLLTLPIQSLAQTGEYFIKHYDNENGLPQNSIKAVEMDCNGFLWLATEMGLVRFDGIRFKYYNQQNSSILKTNRITNLHIDGNCEVKFMTSGLYYRISNTGEVVNYHPEQSEISDTINSHKFPRQQTNLIFNVKQMPSWSIPNYELSSRSFDNSYAYANGCYYYFNQKMEFILFDVKHNTFQKCNLTGDLKAELLLPGRQSNSVSLLKQEEDIYIRCGKTIYKILIPDSGNIIGSEHFLRVDSISNITYLRTWDKYNMKLVGTMGEGFYLFLKKQFSTRLLPDLESNIFYSQAAYGDNGVITKKAVLTPNSSFTFPSYTSESLLRSSRSTYFANKVLSKTESGIVEFGTDLKEKKYLKAYDLRINCFRELKNGEIWFSSNKPFLGRIVKDNIEWIPQPTAFPANAEIKTFIETGENEFLVAGNFGLYKINLAKNICFHFETLSGIDVRCLYEDKRGSVFVGTYGNGFYLLTNSRLIKLPIDKNVYMNSVHAFIEDKRGFLWMSTNRGLFQVLAKDIYDYVFGFSNDIYYQYYDKNDGFLSNEFNGGCTPSVIRLNNGIVSFPSIKGLVQFVPENIQPQAPNADIFIEEIKIDGAPVKNTDGVFQIPSHTKQFEVSVSSPYYGNIYNQDIRYKMDGFDEHWSTLGESGKIFYNRLPAGDYKLLVEKKSGFGKSNLISQQVIFRMQPFFYEAWYFKFVTLFALSGVLLLIFTARIRFLNKQRKKLEAEVKKRTIIQDGLIVELGATVSELERSKNEIEISNTLKERLAMIIAHDLQSPLRFLSQVTQNLYTKAISGDTNEVASISLEIKKSLANIHLFVEEFALCIKSHQRNFQVRKKMFDLTELLQEINSFFDDLIRAKGNQLNIESSEELFVYTDRQLLKIVLRNLIDNANKHTRNGIINISLESDRNWLTITIKDNGSGMDSALVSKLNEQTNETNFVPLLNLVNKGYGYQFIGMFNKVLGLTTQISSQPGKGTAVKIVNLALFDKKLIEKAHIHTVKLA